MFDQIPLEENLGVGFLTTKLCTSIRSLVYVRLIPHKLFALLVQVYNKGKKFETRIFAEPELEQSAVMITTNQSLDMT